MILIIVTCVVCIGCLIGLPAYIIARGRREQRENQKAVQLRIQEAIDTITADGKIEGPKGPYVPGTHHGPRTDGSTTGSRHSGYYHHPWPK
jgi:hypothetical protein